MKNQEHNVFYLLLLFMLISRLYEMILSRKNEFKLINYYNAKLISPFEHYFVYVFHAIWFTFLSVEVFRNPSLASGYESLFCYILLAVAQVLRIESMSTLGVYWTAKIYQTPQHPICRNGIYRYLAHPSYLAVIFEFFAFPFLFHAYWTLTIFFPLNLIIIINRIRLEQKITGRYL